MKRRNSDITTLHLFAFYGDNAIEAVLSSDPTEQFYLDPARNLQQLGVEELAELNQTDIYVQDGGFIEPPEKPGLGLELDNELIEEYRLN